MSTSLDLHTLLGVNARHVPAWLYVQNQGPGLVSFVGASRVPEQAHPLRYGSGRAHQFIVGEIVSRPHLVIATDTLRGTGLAGLAEGCHDIEAMLTQGEHIIGAGQPLKPRR